MNRFLDDAEVAGLGLAGCGAGVRIDRTAIFINPEHISIGQNCRVDASSIVSASDGTITIGANVHLGAGVYLFGGAGIMIEDFAGLSPRCMVFSRTEDATGAWMTNPTVPSRFRQPRSAPVRIGRHAIIGAGSTVLPGVTIGDGVVAGAMTLLRSDVAAFMIVAGNPARVIGTRGTRLLDLEAAYLAER